MKTAAFILFLFLLTACSKVFVRYHGHNYNIIKAGEQYWLNENLATDRYRSGRKIPLVTDYKLWPEITSPGRCYYNNDSAFLKKYGMLYNWYAVDNGKLCPLGWRVPTNNDWLKLEKQLGGYKIAGGKLKATAGWYGKHVSGNDIGFNALPGGYRLNEDFMEGKFLVWWSSTPSGKADFQNDSLFKAYKELIRNDKFIWGRKIEYINTTLISTLNRPNNGFSVRCVRGKKAK